MNTEGNDVTDRVGRIRTMPVEVLRASYSAGPIGSTTRVLPFVADAIEIGTDTKGLLGYRRSLELPQTVYTPSTFMVPRFAVRCTN